jgi:MOSC domain-containing protein YiiM
MKLLSVNVGLPRDVTGNGEVVTTGIFKTPISGRVAVRKLNLDGDRQADLSVHGGPDKAVYVYPDEHYSYWREQLPDMELAWGMFGENLTTAGLAEQTVCSGDRLRIGSATVVVTQPRLPCYKLGIKFARPEIVKQFLQSGRSGFYLAVLQEGEVGAGDAIEVLTHDEHRVSVTELARWAAHQNEDLDLLQRAVQVAALPANWRRRMQQQLAERRG